MVPPIQILLFLHILAYLFVIFLCILVFPSYIGNILQIVRLYNITFLCCRFTAPTRKSDLNSSFLVMLLPVKKDVQITCGKRPL